MATEAMRLSVKFNSDHGCVEFYLVQQLAIALTFKFCHCKLTIFFVLPPPSHRALFSIMEDTTGSIGINLTSPFIMTACTILDQQLGSNTDGELILQVTYMMNYSTRYGHEIIYEYPEYFRSYMNSGGDNVTLNTFYDVIDVPDWSYLQLVGPTVFHNFTLSPTYASMPPSAPPSRDISSVSPKSPTARIAVTAPDKGSLFIGISVGIIIVAVSVVAAVMIGSYGRKKRRRERERDEHDDRNQPQPPAANDDDDNEASAAMIVAAVAAAHPGQSFSRSALLIALAQDQYSGYRVVKREGDAATINDATDIDDGGDGVDNAVASAPTFNSSVPSEGGSVRLVSVSSSPMSIAGSSREFDVVDNGIDGGGQNNFHRSSWLEPIEDLNATVKMGNTDTATTLQPMVMRERQLSNCSEGANLASDIMAQSGLFIDPTTIDYSTIIDLNDAEAGYIMTTTEAGGGGMPNPELMMSSIMTQQQSPSVEMTMFPSDVGSTNEVFASEIMIQTGLLVDPTTIDYSTTTAVLEAENVSDVDDEERDIDESERLVSATAGGPLPTIDERPESLAGTMTSETFLGAVNLMAIRSDSISSNDESFEDDEHLLFSPLGLPPNNEFALHNRTQTLLEILRVEVTSAVNGVDGMISSAIARISSDIAEGVVPPPPLDWVGGEDLGSIEACCLCHAFVWDRKKDAASG